MNSQSSQRPYSQRQLRVGELVKQNLGELFKRNEAKIPCSAPNNYIEVRMTPDLKTARTYVIPLGGMIQKKQLGSGDSHLVRKALSKGLILSFFLNLFL